MATEIAVTSRMCTKPPFPMANLSTAQTISKIATVGHIELVLISVKKGYCSILRVVRVRQQKAVHGSHGLHEIAFGIITPYVDASGSVCGELRRFVQFVTDASDGENVSGILGIGF